MVCVHEAKLVLASEQMQLEETNRKRAEERLSLIKTTFGKQARDLERWQQEGKALQDQGFLRETQVHELTTTSESSAGG